MPMSLRDLGRAMGLNAYDAKTVLENSGALTKLSCQRWIVDYKKAPLYRSSIEKFAKEKRAEQESKRRKRAEVRRSAQK